MLGVFGGVGRELEVSLADVEKRGAELPAEAERIANNLSNDERPATAAAELQQSVDEFAARAEALDVEPADIKAAADEANAKLAELEAELDSADALAAEKVVAESEKLDAEAEKVLEEVEVEEEELEKRVAAFEAELSQREIPESPNDFPVWLDGSGNLIALGSGGADDIVFNGNSAPRFSTSANDASSSRSTLETTLSSLDCSASTSALNCSPTDTSSTLSRTLSLKASITSAASNSRGRSFSIRRVRLGFFEERGEFCRVIDSLRFVVVDRAVAVNNRGDSWFS